MAMSRQACSGAALSESLAVAPASGERTRPRVRPLAPSPKASSRLIASECEFRGEQHASPSEAPRGMKMKLVDACLSLCLTRLIFSSIFESAHPSRVLAEASRLGELCARSRRNALGKLEVRVGGTPTPTRETRALPGVPLPNACCFRQVHWQLAKSLS